MKYYVTTPIYYVNDAPHIGHAYTSVCADVFARQMRAKYGSENVFFLTGTDEHGQKIEKAAMQKGLNPKEFCDEVSVKFKNLTPDFNLSNNYFIRTTDEVHKEGVLSFWNKLEQNGFIYKGKYEGWYSIRDEAFYAEDELINGKAPTGAEVEWQEEESYFFRLSAFTEVLPHIMHDRFVFPLNRLNEVKAFIKGGLLDLSISRSSFKWGVKTPNDKNHVIYVWLDALTNYITALSYPTGKMYDEFWLSNTKKVHFIGKDILRFHAIFWPAFLIAERCTLKDVTEASEAIKNGKKLDDLKSNPVIKMREFFKDFTVVSHGWWTNNGEKMSKSLGNAINPYTLKERTGVDRLRYFMIRNMQFGSDGDFSDSRFIEVLNADLSNNIGNLTQRVMSFIYNNCDAKIPDPQNEDWQSFCVTSNLKEVFCKQIESFNFDGAISEVLNAARLLNQFVDAKAPWNLKKEGKIEEMNSVLFALSRDIFEIYSTLLPIMPEASKQGLSIFNFKKPEKGDNMNKPEPIFTRMI